MTLTVVRVPDPPAGQSFTYSFGGVGLLVAFKCQLNTSAQAGNRSFYFNLTDPSGRSAMLTQFTPTQVAGEVGEYQWAPDIPYTSPVQTINHSPIPRGIRPASGWSLACSSSGLQSGDQFTLIWLSIGA